MNKKVFILEPKEDKYLPRIKRINKDCLGADNPWSQDPWENKCFLMIVLAEDEKEARALAAESKAGERDTMEWKNPWMDEKYSTCIEIDSASDSRVLAREIRFVTEVLS